MYIAPNNSNIPPAEMRTLHERPNFHSSSANQIEQRSPNFDDHAGFCSIKDSARSTQAFAARLLLDKRLRATPIIPPQKLKENRTRNTDPPSRNASKPTIDTRETTFFQEKGECHASSPRLVMTVSRQEQKDQPRPKTLNHS